MFFMFFIVKQNKMFMREMICIVCPKGCVMKVAEELLLDGTKSVAVKGALCKRGVEYATEECVAPKRMVTTLVRVAGRRAPLPVKTATPVPKEKIFDILAATHATHVSPPVRIGDVVVADVCGTGVDIVATSAV